MSQATSGDAGWEKELELWLARHGDKAHAPALERLARGMAALPGATLVCRPGDTGPARIEARLEGASGIGEPFALLQVGPGAEARMLFPVDLVTDPMQLGEGTELDSGLPGLRFEVPAHDPDAGTSESDPEEQALAGLEVLLIEAHDRSSNADA